MSKKQYSKNVFINCPFYDDKYKDFVWALTFVISDCGFNPRCALENNDGSQGRLGKIEQIIEECQFAIHDISQTDLDKNTKLPRFNMPFELGLFLGAKLFGNKHQKSKNCLIFEKKKNSYDKYFSDLSGMDIECHDMKIEKVIEITRKWLSGLVKNIILPSGKEIIKRYRYFDGFFVKAVTKQNTKPKKFYNNISYVEFHQILAIWQKENPIYRQGKE